MRKPIVAVTADTLLADMKPINQKMADYAPRPLLNALGRVGLLPIILAYDDYAGPEEYVDSFDALVLSGGPNPAPVSTEKSRSGASGRPTRREIFSRSGSSRPASKRTSRSSASAAVIRS